MPTLNLPTPGESGATWPGKVNAAITAVNDVMETGRLSDATLSATVGTQVAADVPPAVQDSLANDPTILAPAIAAADIPGKATAAVNADLAARPGLPAVGNYDLYEDMDVSPSGKLWRGLRKTGENDLPVVLNGGETSYYIDHPDYTSLHVSPAGKILADSLGRDGFFLPEIVALLKQAIGAGDSSYPIDVLIVAGQSNATERTSLPVTVSDVDSRVLQWDPAGAMFVVPASAVQWIGNEFAREYVRRVPGRRILVVPCALGSTGFTTTSVTPPASGYTYIAGGGTWDRTLTSDPVNLYAQMISRTQAALAAAGAGARLIGMLWSQGESDRGALTQSQYAAKLDDLISQARTDLGVSDLPVVIGSMTPETIWDSPTGGTADINAALVDTPRRVQRTSYVWGPPDMIEYQNTRIHWSPQGQAVRARRMAAEGLYRARLNVAAAKPVQPQNLKISRSGTAVTISWEAPPARVTSYTLETSTDSGATWTAQTLAGPIVTEFAMTVATNLPVWARIKSTNEVGTTDPTREAKA